MKKRSLSRREFLKEGAGAALAGTVMLSVPFTVSARDKIRVVMVRDAGLFDEAGYLRAATVQQMLDRAVLALLEEKDPVTAWKKLVMADDIVGIKTNVWKNLPTTAEVENAIKTRVMAAGIPEKSISIRDRGVLSDPIFQNATALINARPMRTHHWSGLGTCLKNYIMFVPRPPEYHDDSCADLALLWNLPVTRNKTRLNILVMFTPLFHSIGPHGFNPEHTWRYNGLIVGRDPVAVDAVGRRIIEAKRREFFGEDRPLNPPAKHIDLAETRHHMGVADPARIELIKLGWQEGVMI